MKKKIFALLFVALLSVSLVTGCGSKKDDKKEDKKDTEEKEEVKEEEKENTEINGFEYDENRSTGLIIALDSKIDLRTLKANEIGNSKLAIAVFETAKNANVGGTVKCSDIYGEGVDHVVEKHGCGINEETDYYKYDEVNKKYKEMFNEEAPKKDVPANLVRSVAKGANGVAYGYSSSYYLEYNETVNGYVALTPRYGGYSDTIIEYDDFYKVTGSSLNDNILTIVVKYRTVKDTHERNSFEHTYEIDEQQFTDRQSAEDYVFSHMDNAETLTVKYVVDGNNYYLQSAE